ncbi:MAG: hypothetical protein ACP5KN_00385 [Armatimonadota bacterium]
MRFAILAAAATLLTFGMAQAEGEQMMGSEPYHAVTLLDLSNPLPHTWLEQAHVGYVYASAPALEEGPGGDPVIAESRREQWEEVLRRYEATNVRVLLMDNLYIDPAEEHQAVDVFGRRHPMACFRHPGFQEAMAERIVDLARAFGRYEAFGGFVFDDGPHVRVDCCYCDRCREQFAEQYGVEPPGFEPVQGTDRIADDDPRLLWDRFQQESWQIYLRTQSDALRSVSDDLVMLTIPSDSYFYGRFLNVDVEPEESRPGHGGRLQRIERIQVRDWTIFQSFPLARLPEADETGLQSWATGCHITADSPKMLMQTEGPYAPIYGRVQYMSPAEIERMARVTLTEGGSGICYWTAAEPLPSYPAAFDAMAEVYRDVGEIQDELAARRPHPASIGLLYSSTTEILEQPWRTNTSERWQHLHAFEALAYSMRRCNLPFEIVMEDDLAAERLGGLRALVLPAVRFLSEAAASAIEQAMGAAGLQVFSAGECVPLRGMTNARCDPLIWHRRAARGYRQERYANQQWQEVRTTLATHLRPLVEAPVQVYSERAIGRLYDLSDGDMMLMIASWDLEEITEVAVEGEGRMMDMISGRDLGPIAELGRLTIQPAGWRVLRITQ